MTDHVLRDVHRDKLPAVVDGDGVTHELGQDGRAPRPRTDYLLLIRGVQRIQLFFQMTVSERPFFNGTSHLLSLLRLPAYNPFICALVVARLETTRRLAPRRHRMPAT